MKTKETERFVNEIHNHNAEVRSGMELLENLQESKKGEPYEERKVTTRSKETSAAPSMKETRAGSLSLVPNNASLYTRKIIHTNEKKWNTIHAHSERGSDLAVSFSKTVTTMLRHYDQDERESDESRHWESIQSVFVRKVAHEGARDFSDEAWLQKTFEASTKKIIEYCTNKVGILGCSRAIQGHSGGVLEKVHISQRTFMELPIYIANWTDSRRKEEKDKARQAVSGT